MFSGARLCKIAFGGWLILGLSFAGPVFAQEDNRDGGSATNSAEGHQPLTETPDVVIASTVVALVAVSISALSAYFAHRAIGVTRKSAERQLRAYIAAVPIVEVVRSGETVRMAINAKNYGQTPARNVRVRTAVFVRSLPFSLEDERAENADRPELTARQVIHPTADHYFPNTTVFILSDEAFKALESDKAAIFFTGEIYYDDMFNDPHETRFRFEFSGAECFRLSKIRFCKEGNEAT